MTECPVLSVILVSYHSQDDLARCLPSIQAETPLEIIVVDNDPEDGTGAWVKAHYPGVQVIPSANGGYGRGCNLGMQRARGRYWCVLNPDTVLGPGALDAMMETAEKYPGNLITPALLQPDGTLNAYGNAMHVTGITTCANLGETWSETPRLRFPLLASGAAILAACSVWEALEGFDADYFLYMEDADLSLRARLQGREIICDTRARITHDYTLNLTPEKFYWLERNRWRTLLTTYSGRTLFKMAIPLLVTDLATWFFAGSKGWRYVVAHARVYLWLARYWKLWSTKRARVQKDRVVGDGALFSLMDRAYPLDQLVSNPRIARYLSRASAWFFHWFAGKKVLAH